MIYNIEYSHFYGHEQYGEEHVHSARIAMETIASLRGHRIGTFVFVDDRACSKSQLANTLLQFERNCPIMPGFIGYESTYGNIAEDIIKQIPAHRLKYQDGLRLGPIKLMQHADHSYTCAALSAAWMLCRLGMYKHPAAVGIMESPDVTITILPKRYERVEENVKKIIRACGREDLLSKIDHIYF